MTERENGFATATLALLSGYPGHFYHWSDGEFICGIDDTFGLPIYNCGDVIRNGDWFNGYNQAISPYVQQYGLPWNSRLTSLDVLADLRGYFNREASRMVRLELEGSTFRPNGFGYALSLEKGDDGSAVRLQADKMFKDPKIVPNFRSMIRGGSPPCPLPVNPLAPALGSDSKSIWLRFNDGAHRVECVPAPMGSHLVVCRFSDFGPDPLHLRLDINATFAALDTQLGDWIRGGRAMPKLASLKERPQSF